MIHLEKKLDRSKLEKAVLVGIWGRKVSKAQATEYIDELTLLTDTAGARTMRIFMQRMDNPNPSTYIGKGKLMEIKEFIEAEKIDLVVFDDDLTPSQVKNIDKVLEIKVLDRSGIILHIFADRARTAQAVAQVELAQLEYMLPRLSGLWTHLSKQKGGIGLKGAGEKEIETDRRIIRKKISLLEKKLQKIDKQNRTRRKSRGQLVRVGLVGYTNVGKSTLMNLLTKSDIFAEDKLFATLDTTVRKVVWELVPFLLSDTVGFIRKLPHNLVECFKSTLDEARESDILLHVVDVAHPRFEEQIQVVNQTLADIGVGDKPVLMIFNKVDRLTPEEAEELKESWLSKHHAPVELISAHKKINIPELRKTLLVMIRQFYRDKYPNQHLAEAPNYEDFNQ